jgi:hypothetical protein
MDNVEFYGCRKFILDVAQILVWAGRIQETYN